MAEEISKEEQRLAQERDSFMKTAILAFIANYWAHNPQISYEQTVLKAVHLAQLSWQALEDYRKEVVKGS